MFSGFLASNAKNIMIGTVTGCATETLFLPIVEFKWDIALCRMQPVCWLRLSLLTSEVQASHVEASVYDSERLC